MAHPPAAASTKANSWPKTAPTFSRTWTAAAVTSGPTPSPGIVAIVYFMACASRFVFGFIFFLQRFDQAPGADDLFDERREGLGLKGVALRQCRG